MYDTLLQLPIFQGLSMTDFHALLMKIKLNFQKISAGRSFIHAGNKCSDFVFLINGSIISSRRSNGADFVYKEVISAPYLIEPYSMFGASATYKHDYTALSDVGLLLIDKQYIYTELQKYSICKMNILNMLSGRVQALDRFIWSRNELSLRERIVRFIKGISETYSGEKYLQIRMNTLASLMDATRLKVSIELNAMAEQGLIVLRRKEIYIPSMERLIEHT